MGAKSNWLEDAVLNKVYRQTDFTSPVFTTVSLHTADPGEDGTNAEVSTGDWSNYARETVNTDGVTSPYWSAPADGSGDERVVSNVGDVDFGTATIVTPVTITHCVVWDDSGNPLHVGPLPTQQTINDGNPVKFAGGSLVVGES